MSGAILNFQYRTNATLCLVNQDASTDTYAFQYEFSNILIKLYFPNDTVGRPSFTQSLPNLDVTNPSLFAPDGVRVCLPPDTQGLANPPQGVQHFLLTRDQALQFFNGSWQVRFRVGFSYSAALVSSSANFQISNTLGLFVNISISPLYDSLALVKNTENNHYTAPPGWPTLVGLPVVWEYLVTNQGSNPVTGLQVWDDRGVAVTCPVTDLQSCQSVTCTGQGIALPGQYQNDASAYAFRNQSSTIIYSNNDTSYYYAYRPSIIVLKLTNGVDIRTSPLPIIVRGFPVTWTYVVTNTGDCDLANVTVTDNKAGVYPACPASTLPIGQVMTCTATGLARGNITYTNVGTAQGYCITTAPTIGIPQSYVYARNDSAYLGIIQRIRVLKLTNDVDIRVSPRPNIPFGGAVTWKYVVTNTGSTPLSTITVVDNQIGATVCPKTNLVAGEVMTCSATGFAIAGPYSNVGTATGTSPAFPTIGAQAIVTSFNDSGYFGVNAVISITKYTNNVDTVNNPAPFINAGSPVTWKYAVTNTGNAALSSVRVNDNILGNIPACAMANLAVGASFTCQTVGVAVTGTYNNVGTSSGVSPLAMPNGPLTVAQATVTATYPSMYFGVNQQITIVTYTNDVDIIRNPPRPSLLVGSPVTWKYAVTNNGNSDLSNVVVVDNKVGVIACPGMPNPLVVGASYTCSAMPTGAVSGLYDNIGTATGISPLGPGPGTVTSNYPTGYLGVVERISLVKTTNNIDTVVSGTVPFVSYPSTVTWRYTVTNLGNTALTSVTVNDNVLGLVVSCNQASLGAGGSYQCQTTGAAISGAYANIGTATGYSPVQNPQPVTATYPSGYFGVIQSITIIKYTNDAPVGSPPSLFVGSPVTWVYSVTNIGNSVLSTVTVTDNKFVGMNAACPGNVLTVGQTFTCSITGTAISGTYNNVGTAKGYSPLNTPVTSTAPSSYIGIPPQISIVKYTNGFQLPTRPNLQAGSTVTWTYAVTNPNTQQMTGITVTDNRVSAGNIFCPTTVLDPGQWMTCQATGLAGTTSYDNIGTARGYVGPTPSTATYPSGYQGIAAAISILKTTNGVNTVAAGGNVPNVVTGSTVTWTYTVTNTGNAILSNLALADNQIGSITCSNIPPSLAVGGQFVCTATGTAQSDVYSNIGTATGVSPLGPSTGVVTATWPSGYFGVTPSISLMKLTNGIHVTDVSGAVGVDAGSIVVWTYIVTNIGNFALTAVTVVDNPQGPIACGPGISPLAIGASFACSASGLVPSGSAIYHNTATATGLALGQVVTAFDQSWYNPVVSAIIGLIKRTDGVDTTVAPPPRVRVDEGVVTWTYEVSNLGTVALSSIVVTDDIQGVIACPQTSLVQGSTFTCTATASALDCFYQNVGTASAARHAMATWPSAYIGVLPLISIQKFTDNFDHNTVASGKANPKYPPFIGPCLTSGSPVTWHYIVSNIGDDLLTNVVVTDDQLGPLPVCSIDELGPWWSVTCQVTGTVVDGQYHNIATATGQPEVGGSQVTAWDQNWYIGLNPALVATIEVNGIHFYDSNCDICQQNPLGEGGEGNSKASKGAHSAGEGGHSTKGQSLPTTLEAPKTARRHLLGGEGHSKKGSKSGNGEGKSGGGHSKHSAVVGRNNCTIFNPHNLVGSTLYSLGPDATGYLSKVQTQFGTLSTDAQRTTIPQPRSSTELSAPVTAAAPVYPSRYTVLGGGEGESEGEGSVTIITPLAPPAACPAASLPNVVIGGYMDFTIIITNVGNEWLTNVYLSLDPLCQQRVETVTTSKQGEGKSGASKQSKLGAAVPANPATVKTQSVEMGEKEVAAAPARVVHTLGGSNAAATPVTGNTYCPTSDLHPDLLTQNVWCPTNLLGPGESMNCTIRRVFTQKYGLQQLGVTVQGFGYCTNKCTTAWSATQWWTPAPPPPPAVPSVSSGSEGGSKASKGSKDSKGSKKHAGSTCSLKFWQSSSASKHYPSWLSSSTLIYTAFGLTSATDPTNGLSIHDVLWSRGYDAVSEYFRAFTVALLNAGSVSGYKYTTATIQSTFASVWTQYQTSKDSSVLSKWTTALSAPGDCPF